MAFPEYSDYDGLGLAELVRRGEVSPVELVEAAIERIEKHDGTLDAVVYKAYDSARKAAKRPRTASRPKAGAQRARKPEGRASRTGSRRAPARSAKPNEGRPLQGSAGGALPEGPFRGVPFLIKDLGCPVAGMPRTSGSRFLAHEVPEATLFRLAAQLERARPRIDRKPPVWG